MAEWVLSSSAKLRRARALQRVPGIPHSVPGQARGGLRQARWPLGAGCWHLAASCPRSGTELAAPAPCLPSRSCSQLREQAVSLELPQEEPIGFLSPLPPHAAAAGVPQRDGTEVAAAPCCPGGGTKRLQPRGTHERSWEPHFCSKIAALTTDAVRFLQAVRAACSGAGFLASPPLEGGRVVPWMCCLLSPPDWRPFLAALMPLPSCSLPSRLAALRN